MLLVDRLEQCEVKQNKAKIGALENKVETIDSEVETLKSENDALKKMVEFYVAGI